MPQIGSTIIKLAVASLVVGLLLAWTGTTPRELLESFGSTVVEIFSKIADMFAWTVDYILLGAVVVVPIWLVVAAIRFLRGRLG